MSDNVIQGAERSHSESLLLDVGGRRLSGFAILIDGRFNVRSPQDSGDVDEEGLNGEIFPNADAVMMSTLVRFSLCGTMRRARTAFQSRSLDDHIRECLVKGPSEIRQER